MDTLLEITVLFAMVLTLSLVIERFLEVLRALYDWLDGQLNLYDLWTRQTHRLKDRLEKRMRIFEYVDAKTAASTLQRFRKMLLNEGGEYSGLVPVLSGNLVRAATFKLACKLVGIGIGIGLAFWMHIDLVNIWKEASGAYAKWVTNLTPPWLRITLSGVVLGLGSGPVHKIITTLERKREEKEKKGKQP